MVVELSDVSRRFGTYWALRHLSLQIAQGDALLLTGPNGAGKTTLLHVIATLLRPTLGSVNVFGLPAPAKRSDIRPRLTMLTHDHYFYADLTGRQNLKLLTGVRDTKMSIDEALTRVGLVDNANKSVRTFSAGMKRRLGLARVLLLAPELVLLDEPFGQLDPEGVQLVTDVLQELKAAGTTLVISTHNQALGERVATRHLRLERGASLEEPA